MSAAHQTFHPISNKKKKCPILTQLTLNFYKDSTKLAKRQSPTKRKDPRSQGFPTKYHYNKDKTLVDQNALFAVLYMMYTMFRKCQPVEQNKVNAWKTYIPYCTMNSSNKNGFNLV